jgi:glycosyltransferase involved in cell wall biosynthesis
MGVFEKTLVPQNALWLAEVRGLPGLTFEMNKVKISVFIPSYNGQQRVKRLLETLQVQDYSAFVIHVLIDGSSDGTENLKTEFPEVAFHYFSNGGRAAIRNKALSLCTTKYLLLLDDDMVATNDLVRKHMEFHQQYPNSIVSGNGFRNPHNATSLFGEYLVVQEQAWYKPRGSFYRVEHDKYAFTSCNVSMPLGVMKTLNGFNENLKDGEDFEFAMRALQEQIPIYYNRELLAWHEDWPTLQQYVRRNAEYLQGKKRLLAINPEYNKWLKVPDERALPFHKKFIRSVLARIAMSNGFVFSLLPKSLKFLAFRCAISLYSLV